MPTVGTKTQNGATTTTSQSYSHDNNGSGLAVFVIQGYRSAGGVPSSVTYNGVNLTKIGDSGAIGGVSIKATVWALASAASGSNTVTVNYSDGGSSLVRIFTTSLVGADTTTFYRTPTTNNGLTAAPTVTATNGQATDLILDFMAVLGTVAGTVPTATAGANQTAEATGTAGTDGFGIRGNISSEAGGTSVTMSWALSPATNEYWWTCAVPILAGGQTAVPTADDADGNWLNEAASATNLYASVADASDSTWIQSETPATNDRVRLKLGSLETPQAGTVTVHLRAQTA